MLTVTDEAKKICHETISQLSSPETESKCLRLQKTADSGLTLTFDKPKETDEIITHDGRDLIAVPEKFTSFCADKTLSLDDQGKLYLS